MRVLVWQWGRFGAGPRFGTCLAEALRGDPGIEVTLSLCRDAEILQGGHKPVCEMPVWTYRGLLSFALRLASAPWMLLCLLVRLRRLAPDLAICAMPGPLDLPMAMALRLLRVRLVVVVHDADTHPGDGFPLQMTLQRLLCRCADGLAVLCGHVGTSLRQQGLIGTGRRKLIRFEHPPFAFAMPRAEEAGRLAEDPPRLLCFGRLLPYKGLDLLAEALASRAGEAAVRVRVVGSGPESAALDALRACPGVSVENRWVPETEIGALLAWSDALILPYREASQSGVAAAALAEGRPVIATRVGGLREQLEGASGTRMCEPTAHGLARAIRHWVQTPSPVAPPEDAATAWRQAAARLLLAIGAALPPKSQPAARGLGSRLAGLGGRLSGAPAWVTRPPRRN